MKIVVCVKQVPDTTEVRLDPEKGTLIRAGVPSIMNPDDRAALAVALRLKAEHGGQVTALSMGPAQVDSMMREALATGADEAVLLCDSAFAGSDTLATSTALAAATKKLGADLVLTGRQAIDGDTAQVGPQIAEHLGIPNISYAEKVELVDGGVRATRQFEDHCQVQGCALPCLVSVLAVAASPGHMAPGAIFDAWLHGAVQVWRAADLPVEKDRLGLGASPTQVVHTQPRAGKPGGTVTHAEGAQAARIIAAQLKEHFIW